ncbi:MAG: hypothetical protein V7756_04790 [Halopseudomonas sp.]|uniref:hypothetical protein n=1 Tax=Halopseudomonas sp. TaxID=2901191 RepID=UPI003002B337
MLHGNLRYTHFPYCLKRQEDGRYVLLNRNYKPVGFFTGEWIDYENYPIGVKLKGMTPAKAAELDHAGRDNVEAIFLYNDGCIPTDSSEHMQSYLQRLAILMTIKTDEHER